MRVSILNENKKTMVSDGLDEVLTEIEYDIGKIKPKGRLNHKFWDKNRNLDPITKKKLLDIAKDFIEQLDIKEKVKDITFTGSLASYNWHKKSDIDLHIIINYEDFNENVEIIKTLMTLERSNWNRVHDIMIRGHEVEIYIQDEDEIHHANGVFSIQNEEWIIKPTPAGTDLDTAGALKKAQGLEDDIDLVSNFIKARRYEEAVQHADKLKEKIKNLRSDGLKKDGIYSIENLAFKLLRNSEQIDRLHGLRTEAYDELMGYEDRVRDEIDINIIENVKNQGFEQHKIEKPQDSGPFQTKTMANYQNDRSTYLSLGGNKENGGGKGIKPAPNSAGRSAVPLEECGEEEIRPKIKVKINKKR